MAATENKDYPENISFISTTQPSSHITYANEAFCDVAEYELDEMLAQPHNMVRHPEMPKAAFEQLWQYLNQGKSWMGIVKNRCKGPRHYWVSAFVTPIKDAQGNIVEHQSVRSKPSKEQVARGGAVRQTQSGASRHGASLADDAHNARRRAVRHAHQRGLDVATAGVVAG